MCTSEEQHVPVARKCSLGRGFKTDATLNIYCPFTTVPIQICNVYYRCIHTAPKNVSIFEIVWYNRNCQLFILLKIHRP